MTLLDDLDRTTSDALRRLDRLGPMPRLAACAAIGGTAFVAVLFACLEIGLDFATTGFVLLIVVTLLALLDSFLLAACFSVLAVGCLDFFFVEPIHAFRIGNAQDITALAAFLVTSLTVTILIGRVRGLGEARRRQARLLDLTADSEARLRAAIDTVPVIVWSSVPAGGNDFQNQRLLSYTGFASGQALGMGWMEMLHPDDVPRHGAAWLAAVESGTAFECESRLRRFDGQYRWFLARAEPLRDADGKIVKWYGTNIDIDDRRRAEQALRHSEQRYRNLFQAMAASFWELDCSHADDVLQRLQESGVADLEARFRQDPGLVREIMRVIRVVDVNDQTVSLFGRGDKAELLGSFERFWPEESTGAFAESILARFAGKPHSSVECRLRRIDGSLFDALFTAAYPADGSGRGTLVVGIIDITARKEATAALERSEQRYRDVVRHMPIGLVQVDVGGLLQLVRDLRAQGVDDLGAYIDAHPDFVRRATEGFIVEAANDHTLRMFGAKDVSEMTGPATRYWEASFDTARRLIEGRFRGEEYFYEETKLTTVDGRIIDVVFAAARPSAMADKSLIGLIDITERVRAQEMLNRVQADFAHAARVAMLGELTASIAHEVNQPLAAIVANANAGLRWLNRPQPDLAELREATESIVADAQRAADIIRRVRAMAARQVPEQTLLSLDDVIREALLFLRHELQARGVTVVCRLAPGAGQVQGDRTQLQQVIVNLAVNAMQAMAQAGTADPRIVLATAEEAPGMVRCIVEDSGPGFDPAHADRLFDSFFTTKDGSMDMGMGMGLRICRSIVEAHGGTMTADNHSQTGGARFSFTLPTASAAG
jgi:PAS domain S-box-containing protein